MREKFDRTKKYGNIADVGSDNNLTPEEKVIKFAKGARLMSGIATGPKSQQAVENLIDNRMGELMQDVLEQYALELYVLERQEKSRSSRR